MGVRYESWPVKNSGCLITGKFKEKSPLRGSLYGEVRVGDESGDRKKLSKGKHCRKPWGKKIRTGRQKQSRGCDTGNLSFSL